MHTFIENRVEQAIRHLQPNEAERVTRVLRSLEQESFEKLKADFQLHPLQTPGEQVFALRATPKLRILVKYGDDQTLIVEDIVSHELLTKLFGGAHG